MTFDEYLKARLYKESGGTITLIDSTVNGEMVFLMLRKQGEAEPLVIRLFNVYGGGLIPFSLASAIRKVKHKMSPFPEHEYNVKKSFLWYEDAFEIVMKAAFTEDVWGKEFDVASQHYVRMQDVYEMLFELEAWKPASTVVETDKPELPDVKVVETDCSMFFQYVGKLEEKKRFREGLQDVNKRFILRGLDYDYC